MSKHFLLCKRLLCSSMLACVISPVYADQVCDTEIASIQAVFGASPADISQDSLGQAAQLFKVLKEDCGGGTPFSVVTPIAQQIRSLLGMGDAS